MAKAKLDILLSKLQGRLTGDSEFYVTNRHGKTVISNYPLHKNKKKLTAKSLSRANRRFFGENSTAARSSLSVTITRRNHTGNISIASITKNKMTISRDKNEKKDTFEYISCQNLCICQKNVVSLHRFL